MTTEREALAELVACASFREPSGDPRWDAAWAAARAVLAQPDAGKRTGWPAGMLQDDSRELSRALANKPDSMRHARDAAQAIAARAVLAQPEPSEYTGVRCMCVITGCRAGPGCPHYSNHCKAHIKHERTNSAAAPPAPAQPAQRAEPIGDVVVTKADTGQIVAVTRQDDEGRILSIIAEADPPAPAQPEPAAWMNEHGIPVSQSVVNEMNDAERVQYHIALYDRPAPAALTDEQITAIFMTYGTGRSDGFNAAARAIERAVRGQP